MREKEKKGSRKIKRPALICEAGPLVCPSYVTGSPESGLEFGEEILERIGGSGH